MKNLNKFENFDSEKDRYILIEYIKIMVDRFGRNVNRFPGEKSNNFLKVSDITDNMKYLKYAEDSDTIRFIEILYTDAVAVIGYWKKDPEQVACECEVDYEELWDISLLEKIKDLLEEYKT